MTTKAAYRAPGFPGRSKLDPERLLEEQRPGGEEVSVLEAFGEALVHRSKLVGRSRTVGCSGVELGKSGGRLELHDPVPQITAGL